MAQFNVGDMIATAKSATHPQREHGQTYLREITTTVSPIPRVMSFAGDMITTTK